MTGFDEVSHCPRCGEEGEVTLNLPIKSGRMRGGQNIVFTCRNSRCRWFNTGWNVSVGPNGEIHERPRGPKEYEVSPHMESVAKAQLEQMIEQDPKLRAEYERLLGEQ